MTLRPLLVAVAIAAAAPTFALNTGVPGSGLPSAADYSTSVLPPRADVVAWKTLAQVQPVKQNGKMVAEFSRDVLALDRKDVKLQGFMIPLDIGERQRRFLISAVPPHCSFCMPAGPDSLVEVEAKSPIKFTVDPVVVSGRFAVVKDDPSGVLYRLSGAGLETQ
jgi:hypothetical protein